MKNTFFKYSAILTLVFSIGLIVYYQYTSIRLPLGYDEVDYYDASNANLSDQWLCNSENNIVQFFKLGYGKYRKIKIDFPVVEETKDLHGLRHFHGCLPTYYWNLLLKTAAIFSLDEDLVLRAGNILLILALLLALLILYKGVQQYVYSALCLLALTLLSPWFYESFSTLNFHVFLGTAALLYCFTFVKFIEEKSLKYLAWWSFSIIIMLLTLETFIVVLLSSFIVLLFVNQQLVTWVNLRWSLFFSLLALLVLNPGSFISFDFIKSWFMYSYRIFLKSNQEYSGISPFANWLSILKGNAPFIFVVIYLLVITVRNNVKPAILPLVLGVTYLFFITFFSVNNSYFFPGFILLTFAGVIVLQSVATAGQILSQSVLMLATIGAMLMFFFTVDLKERMIKNEKYVQDYNSDMNYISAHVNGQEVGVSDEDHILKKYTSLRRTQKLVIENNRDLIVRVNYDNIEFSQYQKLANVKYVVLQKTKISPEVKNFLSTAGFQSIDLNIYILFIQP